jgi:AcrR family transcriptional regulator
MPSPRLRRSRRPKIAAAAVAPTPRATTRANGDVTRERILDAAEALFGERTFDTVSLRDITEEAGVTLALTSYHYGSKENLFARAVARRAAVLNQMRRERLASAPKNAGARDVLDAFMRPLFDQMSKGEPGWQSYLLITSKLAQGNRWLNLLREHFDETARLFVERLAETLPEAPRPLLLRGFSLALDCMLQTLSKNRRVDSLSDGVVSADDLAPAYEALLSFAVGGMEALRAEAKAKGKAKRRKRARP